MNCKQARALLSAYRELKSGELETTDLDAHLEECAGCREVLASFALMGEHLRSAPPLRTPQDMHEKVMKALAEEQLKLLQKSVPGEVQTPAFLKPYLQQKAREMQEPGNITFVSTAETGPLPPIHAQRKRRQAPVNQLSVLGLVAALLFLFMIGGLSSLLMLARNNPGSISRATDKVNRSTEIDQKIYTTSTFYPYVTSATSAGNFIYYTAYSTDPTTGKNQWMLLQFDRDTQLSQPLLTTASDNPLVILSASNDWLTWIEYDLPKPLKNAYLTNTGNSSRLSSTREWKLEYLSLAAFENQTTNGLSLPATIQGKFSTLTAPKTPESVVLTQGIFNNETAPGWVATPVQGTSLSGNTLLVTQIDRSGISRLVSYQLGLTGKAAKGKVLATATPGHVLSWPTTNDLGTQVYWGDEWLSADGTLHGNIWQQQAYESPIIDHGRGVAEQTTTVQSLFLSDGLSFEPQVVNNTLFFLSTSEMAISAQGIVGPNGVALPASATDNGVAFTPDIDPSVYAAPLDASLHGTIVTIDLSSASMGAENILGSVGQSVGLQAGANYALWQDNTGYRMYDVQSQSYVVLGDALDAASLLSVNGSTTLWLTSAPPVANLDGVSQELTLMLFNWVN